MRRLLPAFVTACVLAAPAMAEEGRRLTRFEPPQGFVYLQSSRTTDMFGQLDAKGEQVCTISVSDAIVSGRDAAEVHSRQLHPFVEGLKARFGTVVAEPPQELPGLKGLSSLVRVADGKRARLIITEVWDGFRATLLLCRGVAEFEAAEPAALEAFRRLYDGERRAADPAPKPPAEQPRDRAAPPRL